METTIVDDSCHPGVVVDSSWMAANYAVLVIGKAAFCGEGCEGIILWRHFGVLQKFYLIVGMFDFYGSETSDRVWRVGGKI